MAAGELESSAIAFEMRRLLRIERLKSEVVDAGYVMPAGIVARGKPQDGAGVESAKCSFQCGGIRDGDFCRMNADREKEEEKDVAHDAFTPGTRLTSRNKARFPLGLRQQTGVFFSKEPIAIRSDKGVGEVAQRTGDDFEDGQPSETSAHERGELQGSIAFGETALRSDEDHAMRLRGIEAVLAVELRTEF